MSPDRMGWMMAEHESVPCIGMVRQGLIEPRRLHAPFASMSGPEGVDEDEKQIVAAYEIGQPFLTWWPVAGQVRQNFPEHALTCRIVGRVVSRRVKERDLGPVQPVHFPLEPVAPLISQGLFIIGETDDLVTRKADELRLGAEPGKDGIHPCKFGLLRFSRHSGATVRIADELMANSAARGEGSDRGRKQIHRAI